ncbi:hypothetical protein G6F37_003638 [Rhizopus arrhizus]|nr:hypothetical protein G6F38_002093 [Rhizopus arrhizus]KAG1160818.1 hypothetical protein G6F37_003638 [Rhizopus arrhizus]
MPKAKQNTKDKENEINSWIEQQAKITRRSSLIPYDYFTYASLINQDKGFTNMNYLRALSKAKNISPLKAVLIEKMESMMKQRDNSGSKFGKLYNDYWTKRDNAKSRNRIEKVKRRTRESIVQSTIRLMTTTASNIAGPSEEVVLENEAGNDKSEKDESEGDESNVAKLDDTINICKKAGFGLGELNIIDLTDNIVYDFFKQSLKPELFEKLKLPISIQWKEEPYCKKLLNALCEPHADQRDLCQILRTPVIKPEDYRSAKHYDLRAVENIAGIWIDLMCSPSNSIVTERGERTSAMDGVTLVIKNLFRPFNDIVHTRWIGIKEDCTKRHKWDGVVSTLGGKASVMLIEFAGGFVNVDRNKLKNDTIKIYRNAARLLNSKNSSPENPPSIFVVISHKFKIYFETLTLVTDRAYVRTRTATIDIPFSPNGLKTAME